MKIAIAIDHWKESVFRRHLDEAGYAYEFYPRGETEKVSVFQVEATEGELADLQSLCVQANSDCRYLKIGPGRRIQ